MTEELAGNAWSRRDREERPREGYVVDGVHRVGPTKNYSTVSASIAQNLDGCITETKHELTDQERIELAYRCVDNAVNALCLEHPLRMEAISLRDRLGKEPNAKGRGK